MNFDNNGIGISKDYIFILTSNSIIITWFFLIYHIYRIHYHGKFFWYLNLTKLCLLLTEIVDLTYLTWHLSINYFFFASLLYVEMIGIWGYSVHPAENNNDLEYTFA